MFIFMSNNVKCMFNSQNMSHLKNHLVSGVKMRQKPPHMMSVAQRKMSSQEEINKRLSLPADLKLPDNFVEKLAVSPTLDGPLSRATRRQSLSEIGACNTGNPEEK